MKHSGEELLKQEQETHVAWQKLKETEADAERYRKLRAWFFKPKLEPSDADWMGTWASSDEPDPHAFDSAVDTLPEPERDA